VVKYEQNTSQYGIYDTLVLKKYDSQYTKLIHMHISTEVWVEPDIMKLSGRKSECDSAMAMSVRGKNLCVLCC